MRWEAMKSSRRASWTLFLLSRLTSVQNATSLGQTPSIFSGMLSQETCRGLAWCSDSPFRPVGTGAQIRSVKQMGSDCEHTILVLTQWRLLQKSIVINSQTHKLKWSPRICTHIYAPLYCLFLPDSTQAFWVGLLLGFNVLAETEIRLPDRLTLHLAEELHATSNAERPAHTNA